MANTDWASNFFGKVTSRLPDLLTKYGEGRELEAFEELRGGLVKEASESNKARAAELQVELDRLNGKALAPDEAKADPAQALPQATPAQLEAKAAKAGR